MTAQAPADGLVKVKGARKITAKRMLGSLQNTAQVTLTRYAQGEAAQKLRAKHADGAKVTLNDIVLHGVARVLPELHEINSRFHGDRIERCSNVNLGFAVDTGRALLVPVIRDADRLTLTELAEESQTKAALAKSGKITTAEMSDATFTVSNLGGFGIHWFTPVINTPEVGILGVGAMQESVNGGLQIPLSLTFDHQALDGVAAARALAAMAEAIEAPTFGEET